MTKFHVNLSRWIGLLVSANGVISIDHVEILILSPFVPTAVKGIWIDWLWRVLSCPQTPFLVKFPFFNLPLCLLLHCSACLMINWYPPTQTLPVFKTTLIVKNLSWCNYRKYALGRSLLGNGMDRSQGSKHHREAESWQMCFTLSVKGND